jgi:hypothetical protein
MHQDRGELTEIYLNGKAAGRIRCDPRLVPAPGQYVLAHAAADSGAPLSTPVFSAGPCPGGFYTAPPFPIDWQPGTRLNIRGPFGKGFQLPPGARFVALAAFDEASCSRLLALLEPALAQRAAVVLLADDPPEGLPAAIEISPLSALAETLRWADMLALDTTRPVLPTVLGHIRDTSYSREGQVLVHTPIPCAGMGECGACAIRLRKGYRLGCKDGPVFDLKSLFE